MESGSDRERGRKSHGDEAGIEDRPVPGGIVDDMALGLIVTTRLGPKVLVTF